MPVPSKQVGANVATDPQITVVDIPTADTEQSHTLIDGLKQLIIKLRTPGPLRVGWAATDTDDGNDYGTIVTNGVLILTHLKFTGKTLYFRTSVAPNELEVWELY